MLTYLRIYFIKETISFWLQFISSYFIDILVFWTVQEVLYFNVGHKFLFPLCQTPPFPYLQTFANVSWATKILSLPQSHDKTDHVGFYLQIHFQIVSLLAHAYGCWKEKPWKYSLYDKLCYRQIGWLTWCFFFEKDVLCGFSSDSKKLIQK